MIKNIHQSSFKSFLIIVFSFVSTFLFAQSIAPSESQTLYQHLLEVNKEWAKQKVDLPILQKEMAFKSDDQRIQIHLMLVAQILKDRKGENLSTQQFSKRQHHLSVLNAYWQKGIFPKNISHQKRQPYFIDHLGTACAVGHLIREDDGKELTEKIKTENNYAYLSELQIVYPELESWADNNGFTLDELAWIQPGYPPAEQSWGKVGNGEGTDGQINVMKTVGDKLYIGGDFSSVDGVVANSIIAWDGSEWKTVGEGVEGEIFAMETTPEGHLIIGGNFTLNSNTDFSNIAMWDGNEWIGLQKGEMNGSVYTLRWKDQLYAGGDFENIDGEPIKYFAKRQISINEAWNNNANTIQNAMEVNAPVRAIELIDDKLLVGGEFTQTAPQIMDGSVNQLNTRYLAYWNDDIQNWETEFDGEYWSVNSIGYFNEKIYIGGEVIDAASGTFDDIGIGIFDGTQWNNWPIYQLDVPSGDALIHGFLNHNEQFYAYGDISNQPFVGTYSSGFVGLETTTSANGLSGGAIFDKSVRATAVYHEHVYFAGDFTTVGNGGWTGGNSTYNGLTYSALDGVTSTEGNFITKEIQIYHAAGKLYINYEDLENNAALNIYNLQGQMLKTINLQEGAANEIFQLPDWTAGMYVYQIVNEEGQQSGKFAAF